MGKFIYLWNRVAHMDYAGWLRAAKLVHFRSGKNTLVTLLDMALCGAKYQAGYMDYLVFEFEKLSAAQRATYVTRGVNNQLVKTLNDPALNHLFSNKAETLKAFAPFVKRAWIYLPETDEEGFREFFSRCKEGYGRFVAKPLDGSCGRGISFIRCDIVDDPGQLYLDLKERGLLLCEEYLVQHPDMAALAPKSVNTLRLVTVFYQGKAHLVFPSIRIGNGKNVDNLNAGGMASIIDPEKGCICKPCADKDGNVFDAHPITGTVFENYPIPCWQEAKELVLSLAAVEPRVGYVGWDIAISDKGPELIEANNFPGHDIYQFRVHLNEDRLGIKPRFDAIFRA
ncbi:MAG: hypothetical protein J6A68_00550 [Oscillospiraceae bacterium]|nr:hypothetical protein [Oscillospiraceae bacterium]